MLLHKVSNINYTQFNVIIGVVEIRVNPAYEAEFVRMGDRLGILIVPLIKAAIPSSIPSVDHLKGISYEGREVDESNKSSIQSSGIMTFMF